MSSTIKGEKWSGWLFVLPFTLSFTLFFVFAIARTIAYSFTDYDLFKAPAFVGFANYLSLFSDAMFLIALRNSLSFALVVTVAQTVLALLLASLVNRAIHGKGIVRTVAYLPSIMSSAAMTIIFLWLFQRDGLMTELTRFVTNTRWYILVFICVWVCVHLVLVLLARRRYDDVSLFDPFFLAAGLVSAIIAVVACSMLGLLPVYDETFLVSWLNTQRQILFMPQTLWSVALMNIFTTVPTLMLLFLAGLQSIPLSLYEAAKLDGANAFQRFRDVTVPSLTPVTFAVVTLGIIGTLQMFDQVAILGDAAPMESRVTLAYYVYDNAFPSGASSRIGMAAAAALVLGVLTIIVVYVQKALGVRERI